MPAWVGFLIIGVVAAVLIAVFKGGRTERRSELLPPPGKATMDDVKRLAKSGQTIFAIRCYRELHQCGLAEAKQVVDRLRADI